MLFKKSVLAALLLWSLNGWALPADIQAAKDEGMRLYGIGISVETIPYLEPAAEAGDVEAMYYLAEVHRLRHMGLTTEAMEWYLKAAEQGDPYAMLRLFQGGACIVGDRCPEGSDDWQEKGWREAALEITLPKAEAGDPEAMLAMYYIYANLDTSWLNSVYNLVGIPTRAGKWLKRAAEAGLPEAQTMWGNQIMGGRGWYFTKSRRLATAERWLRQAAEHDYAPAMNSLGKLLREQENYSEAIQWFVNASEHGHINGRMWLASCYIDPDEDPICSSVEQDRVKGWAIYYAINQEANSGTSERSLSLRRDLLSEEERRLGEELAEEWLNKEPPLSNFPHRFGF
jgi:uncharacterized protein